MIEYLKAYNLTTKEYNYLCNNLDQDLINRMAIMQDNVCEILQFLADIGIKNLVAVLMYRPDLCFRNINMLKKQISELEPKMLVSIIDNNIDDLVCFNI